METLALSSSTLRTAEHKPGWFLGKLRAWLERVSRRKAERQRHEARLRRLDDAGLPSFGLDSATALVEQIVEVDAMLADRLELEGLLERYVDLEIAASRYSSIVLGRYGVPVIPRSPLRVAIRERAMALKQSCEAKLLAVRDELECIVELLRLVLHQCILRDVVVEGDPVGERLQLLEAIQID